MFNWLFGTVTKRARKAARPRLTLETLESREVLAGYLWTGTVSGNWTDGGNWRNTQNQTTGVVPGAMDDAEVMKPLMGNGCTVNANAQVGNLSVVMGGGPPSRSRAG